MPHHLHSLDGPRVQREDPLHPGPEGDLAHGHRRPGAAAPQADDQPLEDLHALALGLLGLALDLLLDVRLLDAHVHPHGVAGAELRQGLLEVRRLDSLDRLHGSIRPYL